MTVNGFVALFAQNNDPPSPANNLFGSAGIETQQLATWNGTYNLFSLTSDGNRTPLVRLPLLALG
jgi:hypothetical protein